MSSGGCGGRVGKKLSVWREWEEVEDFKLLWHSCSFNTHTWTHTETQREIKKQITESNQVKVRK